MPAKRNYTVKGTKDFLVMALICFFLCLWASKDAWFPSSKVREKHPRRVEVAFSVDGAIKEFHVAEGDHIVSPKDGNEPTLLASLIGATLQKEFDAKKADYAASKDGSPEKAALLAEIRQLKTRLEGLMLHCPELGKEKGGKVGKMLLNRYDRVKAGQPVMEIKPNQGFYLFNKSLAIFTFIGFWVFLGIHILAQ